MNKNLIFLSLNIILTIFYHLSLFFNYIKSFYKKQTKCLKFLEQAKLASLVVFCLLK